MYNTEDKREIEEDAVPFDKQVAAGLAKVMAAVAVIMTYSWASKKEESYLGGLEWDDPSKVFNWSVLFCACCSRNIY